jgi:hypothetical protein
MHLPEVMHYSMHDFFEPETCCRACNGLTGYYFEPVALRLRKIRKNGC